MKKTGIILFLIFVSNLNYAQEHFVQGFVHAFENVPLIGVEIKVKSSKQTVKTDSQGHFIASCYGDDKLTIKARGFQSQKVKIANNTKIVAVNLKLKPGEQNQKNAIGYGYISDKDKTTAIQTVNPDHTTYARYSDMYDLIISQFAGVQITNGEIIIRGPSSFQGSSAALIVVDGVILDSEILNTISPVDVKSISVIKDGSSAIYGSRGANGVLIIETRKGGDEIK